MSSNRSIAIVFFLVIFAPLIVATLGFDKTDNPAKKSKPVKPPAINLTLKGVEQYPLEFTRYFDENFGMRPWLLKLNFLINYYCLGVGSKGVIIGKEGWLFSSWNREDEDYRGITRYSAQQLENLAFSLEAKRQWLAKKGITYYFVIAPNKTSIYGEHLPGSLNKVRPEASLDDVYDYLQKNTKVNLLDLRPVLIESKKQGQVYYKLDTHWNNLGAFNAYRFIVNSITDNFGHSIDANSIEQYKLTNKPVYHGDLSRGIHGKTFLREDMPVIKPVNNSTYKEVERINTESYKYNIVTEKNDRTLPRILVFRDSFYENIVQYFSEHFSYARYNWQYWDSYTPVVDIVAKAAPAIVIEEIVERLLKENIPDFKKDTPEFMVADAFRSGTEIFSLGRVGSMNAITCNNQVSMAFKAGRLTLDATGIDPQIYLPEMTSERRPDQTLIVKLDYSSEMENLMQFFYLTADDKKYSAEKCLDKKVLKGNFTAYIKMPDNVSPDKLRIDPSIRKGKITINKLEIRAVPTARLL